MKKEELRFLNDDDEEGLNVVRPEQSDPHVFPATQKSLYARVSVHPSTDAWTTHAEPVSSKTLNDVSGVPRASEP